MHKINLSGIKCYGYHGCLPEEAKIGQEYILNIEIETNFTEAISSDKLEDTVDYCAVYDIVKSQMNIRQKLIEVVGQNILSEIKNKWKTIETCTVHVIKPFPPIGGDVEEVSISVTG